MGFSFFGTRPAEPPATRARIRLALARETFEAAVDALLDTAEAAGPAGSPEWDQELRRLGLKPESEEARRRSAQEGLAQAKGAPLIEVRTALTRLVEEAEAEYWDIHRIHPFLDEYSAHRSRLTHAVQRETDRYADRVKPRAALANVFATALQSSQKHAAQAGQRKLQTMRCLKCGAPRLDDQVVACPYCGHTLFE